MGYIDLGLPSGNLWDTCNVGANKFHECGRYYNYYEILNLQTNEGLLPFKEDWEELVNKCTWTWTTLSDVNGYKVTGPNGNRIFLPAAGSNSLSSPTIVGKDCDYWSFTNNHDYTYYLYLCKHYYCVYQNSCGGGHPIRLIKKKNNMEKRKIEIDINTAKEWYNSNNEYLKAIALQAFSEQELTKFLPETWKDWCIKHNNCHNTKYYIDKRSNIIETGFGYFDNWEEDKNVLNTKEDAEAHLALMQLHVLRDSYRDYYQKGWKPDWTSNNEYKHCIVLYKQKVQVIFQCGEHRFLSFPTKELAEQFLENFKDLIRKAKDLI